MDLNHRPSGYGSGERGINPSSQVQISTFVLVARDKVLCLEHRLVSSGVGPFGSKLVAVVRSGFDFVAT